MCREAVIFLNTDVIGWSFCTNLGSVLLRQILRICICISHHIHYHTTPEPREKPCAILYSVNEQHHSTIRVKHSPPHCLHRSTMFCIQPTLQTRNAVGYKGAHGDHRAFSLEEPAHRGWLQRSILVMPSALFLMMILHIIFAKNATLKGFMGPFKKLPYFINKHGWR